ncbi:MAG: hypothetical protein R2845_00135 [Thermomicrobiales bacterium]
MTLQQDLPTVIEVGQRSGFDPVPAGPLPFHPRAWYPETGGPEYEAFLGIGRGPNGAAVGGEWDLAAPDLILHEAGGRFSDELGRTIVYNKDDSAIRHGVIAAIDPGMAERLVSTLARCATGADPFFREAVTFCQNSWDHFTAGRFARILRRSDL